MNLDLENGWHVLPIDGDTGTAYMGINNNEKLFLKRNTSPFLAALSIEEITPRLVWTKRMTSGDTLTAQEWMDGRCLKRKEMTSESVSALLYRVHHSQLLRRMLRQVGGSVLTPRELLNQYFRGLPADLRHNPLLKNVANRLRTTQPYFERSNYEVCHGDLNHKNWLLSEENRLYLVDWESAIIADPAYDLSMLICQYVPRQDWEKWLVRYYQNSQEVATDDLRMRINWYSLSCLLLLIKEKHQRGRFHEMNQDIIKLSEVLEQQQYI
ncbi:phosphotransferase family protein [Ligilactobacillus sp. WILCCON 0076]|uniref:Phosphotransferase family protein n=1 Tax=Ligilactobacillus ubinensis TaxID=2876789 RepID=A0A9X2FJ35_9LACO|nr:phosphotransferase family protein [Ligilactobacillus ubinensis]MCP0886747.1 phosphotransferase family protein [Ligilactobacillus ubinensis]